MAMHPPSDDAIARQPSSRAEPPRAEPEIIPPGADFPSQPHRETFVFAHRGIRIHVTRLGPFGIAMLLLGGVALGAIGLLMLLGTVLVGAAAIGVVVAAALLSRLFRGPPKP
jgi:hypothetical protein